jgi:hypothetical protein
MRACEILMEHTDYLQVPAGIWKQVMPREHHDAPKWTGNVYSQVHYDKPSTKAWELHTPEGMISVLNQGPGRVRHIQGYEQFTPDWLRKNLQPLLDKAQLELESDSDLRMVEGELVWPHKEFPLTPVVQTPAKYTWFQTDWPIFTKYYRRDYDYAHIKDATPGDLYVMRDTHMTPRTICVLIVNNNKIVQMAGHVTQEQLTPLLKKIHVKHSVVDMRVGEGRTHVQDGMLRNTDHLLETEWVGELSDQSKVYKIEPQYRMLVQAWFKKSYANADVIYMVKNPHQRAVFAIKSGKIVGKASLNTNPTQLKKWSQLLASELKLGIDKPESAMIKPDSLMHKMLRHIKHNPGGNRSDVFVRGLGRKSTLGLGSINDKSTTDGFAWSTGLIQPFAPGGKSYAYKITPKGIMVLAALDAGKSVPENSLMDWSKS